VTVSVAMLPASQGTGAHSIVRVARGGTERRFAFALALVRQVRIFGTGQNDDLGFRREIALPAGAFSFSSATLVAPTQRMIINGRGGGDTITGGAGRDVLIARRSPVPGLSRIFATLSGRDRDQVRAPVGTTVVNGPNPVNVASAG